MRWKYNTRETEAAFTPASGKTYSFVVQAVDAVGNFGPKNAPVQYTPSEGGYNPDGGAEPPVNPPIDPPVPPVTPPPVPPVTPPIAPPVTPPVPPVNPSAALPLNLTQTPEQDGSVTLGWAASDSSGLLGYELRFGTDSLTTVFVGPDVTSAALQNLSDGQWNWQVRAVYTDAPACATANGARARHRLPSAATPRATRDWCAAPPATTFL